MKNLKLLLCVNASQYNRIVKGEVCPQRFDVERRWRFGGRRRAGLGSPVLLQQLGQLDAQPRLFLFQAGELLWQL